MNITKSDKTIKPTFIFNRESIGYSTIFFVCLIAFAIIKQFLKIAIHIDSSIALPAAFCIASMISFFAEKKYAFHTQRNSMPIQLIGCLIRIVFNIAIYVAIKYVIVNILHLNNVLPYTLALFAIFVINYAFDKYIIFRSNEAPSTDSRLFNIFSSNRYILLSMLITSGVLLVVFLLNKVYPFGQNTVLRIDSLHQYGPLMVEFYDRVIGLKTFVYSWTSGGGSSFIGNYFNYLSSPLTILIFLFNRNEIGYAVTLLVIIKLALSAGAFAYYIKQSQKCHGIANSIFGIFYALCAFCLANYWNIMWLDAMILLPFVTLGIEKIINTGKCKLYIISLSVMLFSNYYMGYMICIFSAFYFVVYYFANNGFKDKLSHSNNSKLLNVGFKFAISSILVGMICAFFLIPVFNILQSCSATSNTFPTEIKSLFGVLDFLSCHLAGVKPTIYSKELGSYPNIYCGIMPALLIPLYLLNKEIKAKEKIVYSLFLLFLVLSMNINVANFIWHAMHFPNDLPYRFSFIYVFVFLIVGYRCLMHIKGISKSNIIATFILAVAIMLILYKKPTANLNRYTIFLSLGLAIIWTGLLIMINGKIKKQSVAKMISICLIMLTTLEITAIGASSLEFLEMRQSRIFKNAKTYSRAIDYIEENDNDFYKIELTQLEIRLAPCIYGYNGISNFSSMANEQFSRSQNAHGIYSNKINAYTYRPQTPVYNMMYNIKYLIKEDLALDLNSDYYEEYYTTPDKNQTRVYKNNMYLPIAFVTDNDVLGWTHEPNDPFMVQQDLIERASGTGNIFVPVEYGTTVSNTLDIDDITKNGTYSITNNTDNDTDYITTTIKSVKNSNVYVYIKNKYVNSVEYSWNNGKDHYTQETKSSSIIDLGKFNTDDEINVKINFTKCASEAELKIFAYNIDDDALSSAYDTLKQGQIQVSSYNDTSIEGTINAEKEGVLYTSIPFDKGWHIYVDEKEVDTLAIGDCQLGTKISKGNHSVKMQYKPRGIYLGFAISVSSLIAIAVYLIINKKSSQQK